MSPVVNFWGGKAPEYILRHTVEHRVVLRIVSTRGNLWAFADLR